MSRRAINAQRETKVPDIPDPLNAQHGDILRALKERSDVREGLTGDPLDQVVTYREMFGMGALPTSFLNGQSMVRLPGRELEFLPAAPSTSPEFVPPPAPKNLQAIGAIANVIISFDDPAYHGHAYAEIWRAQANDLGAAVRVGTTDASLYADNLGQTGVTVYYWVRFVSQANIVGPFNGTAGTAATTGVVFSGDIADASITTSKIADAAVITAKLGDASVSTTKLGDNAVTTAKIGNTAVTTTKLADGSVITTKILDGAVDADKIAANAVVAGKIAAGTIVAGDGVIANAAIGTALIQDAAIINAKIGTAAVDTAKIADAAIVTAKIADANISSAKIANAAIVTAHIAAAAITNAQIADAAITNAKILDGEITSAKIGDAEITSAKIVSLEASKVSASELSEIVPSLGIITSGRLRNAADTNFVDLDATGSGVFLQVGSKVSIDADGNAFFDGVVISRQLEEDNGTYNPADEAGLTPIASYTELAHWDIDTAIPLAAWGTTTELYTAASTISGTIVADLGDIPDVYWGVVCTTLPLTKWSGSQLVKLRLSLWGKNVKGWTSLAFDWVVYKVT